MDDDELSQLVETLVASDNPGKKLRALVEQLADEQSEFVDRSRSPESTERLREVHALYATPNSFKVGDLVVWKPGLKNRSLPAYGVPAVVIEVIDPPILDTEKSTGSTYYREPITLRLGVLDRDQELLIFHFDGNRFTHQEA